MKSINNPPSPGASFQAGARTPSGQGTSSSCCRRSTFLSLDPTGECDVQKLIFVYFQESSQQLFVFMGFFKEIFILQDLKLVWLTFLQKNVGFKKKIANNFASIQSEHLCSEDNLSVMFGDTLKHNCFQGHVSIGSKYQFFGVYETDFFLFFTSFHFLKFRKILRTCKDLYSAPLLRMDIFVRLLSER